MTPERRTVPPLIVSIAIVAIVICFTVGLAIGSSEAPTHEEAVASRQEALNGAKASAYESSFKLGTERGFGRGAAAGKRRGERAGEDAGSRAGEDAAAKQLLEEAESAAPVTPEDCPVGQVPYAPGADGVATGCITPPPGDLGCQGTGCEGLPYAPNYDAEIPGLQGE